MCLLAQSRLSTDTTLTCRGICSPCFVTGWDLDVKDLKIQEMIDQAHATFCRSIGGSVNTATWERSISDTPCSLEVVGEFILDEIHFLGIGTIVFDR